MNLKRRTFLQNSSKLIAGIGLSSITGPNLFAKTNTSFYTAKNSSNETISVGLIGCNNMGWNNLLSVLRHPNVECYALCDIDNSVLDKRISEIQSQTGKMPKLYKDYRKLLDNKDIDVVIIGTPDHWHCLQMVHACEAGKDVYVEKPIANTIEECNIMVAAKNKYKSIVQVGQWQRSDPHWIKALEYLNSGRLGTIRSTKSWAFVEYGRDFPIKQNQPVPQGVDYDLWLGPAPKRPFNPNRFHGSWRYFWDYGGGLMTDWGVHMIDMILSGTNTSVPISVKATGGKYGYPNSAAETPDTLQSIYNYGDLPMIWEQSLGTGRGPYNRDYSAPGVAFVGNKGTLAINRNTWEVYPEEKDGNYLTNAISKQIEPGPWTTGLDHHTLNFLECVRSRQQPNCTIEMGRNAAISAQLGKISYRVGSEVLWNEEKNEIVNNSKAQDMTKAEYRSPWNLPVI